jgi:hypothetical protein
MLRTWLLRVSIVAAAVLGLGLVFSAVTASNVVPTSHAWAGTQAITANTLKPSACASITIADLAIGSGTVSGTSSNDLILGSSGNDTLGSKTGGGSDCCIAGGGSNTYQTSCTVKK